MRQLSLLLISAAAIWFPAQALACSCRPPDPDEYLSNANLVFSGTVLSVEEVIVPQIPLAPGVTRVIVNDTKLMRAKFKVGVLLKGQVQDEVEIEYAESNGGNCGWRFAVGQDTFVIARGNRKTKFSTGMCIMLPYRSDKTPDITGANRYVAALGLYRSRRDAFVEKLRETGNHEQVLREQVAFFIQHKDLDEADEAYSRLLHSKPHDAAALAGRGKVRYDAARYEEALADYRAALTANSGNADARRGRTLSLVQLGRMKELGADDRNFSAFDSSGTKGLSFAGINLAGANFRGAKLYGVDFSGADLGGADFSAADLYKCNFSGAKLAKAKFDNLKGSYDTTFQQAGLQSSSFKNANLFHAKFDGAILDKADFSKAQLEAISLTDTCYDDKTIWPEGFNPRVVGAKICQ